MSARGLIVFRHDSDLGNAPAKTLFDRVKTPPAVRTPPRSFADYEVTVDEAGLPAGIQVQHLI